MILLQSSEGFGVFKALAEYGVLGLVTLALGFVVWFLLRRELNAEQKQRERVDQLQRDLTKYITEDRTDMIKVLRDNTEAFGRLEKAIENFSKR